MKEANARQEESQKSEPVEPLTGIGEWVPRVFFVGEAR